MSEIYHIKQEIPLDQFRKFDSHIVYFLGFLKGEGLLDSFQVDMFIEKRDLPLLRDFFKKIGIKKENIIPTKRKSTRTTQNKNLFLFLEDIQFYRNTYYKNSHQVWQVIPKAYTHLFLRGLIDANGDLYVYQTGGKIVIRLNSKYDWSFPEAILNKSLGITDYTMIKKVVNGQHKDMIISISQEEERLILLKNIYFDYPKNQIGLQSNYNKWLKMQE